MFFHSGRKVREPWMSVRLRSGPDEIQQNLIRFPCSVTWLAALPCTETSDLTTAIFTYTVGASHFLCQSTAQMIFPVLCGTYFDKFWSYTLVIWNCTKVLMLDYKIRRACSSSVRARENPHVRRDILFLDFIFRSTYRVIKSTVLTHGATNKGWLVVWKLFRPTLTYMQE